MTATRKKPVKQGATSRSKSKRGSLFQRVPGWLLLVTGLLAGFMLALLVMLAPGVAEQQPKSKPKPETVKTPAAVQPEAEPSKREPVFDFYKLLPESEVVVPEPATTTAKPAPVQKPSASSRTPSTAAKADDSRYLLQTGSFRNKSDAERLRAQLILWGLDARIQQVQVKNGEYWHRVQVGPLNSMSQVNNVQKTLAEHKVDSLLLKLR